MLGSFAALVGAVLALLGGWMLSTLVFETAFVPALFPIAGVAGGIVFLTILIGMLNSVGILDHPPLAVLRWEE
jgi:putative ABC transport system permease protein